MKPPSVKNSFDFAFASFFNDEQHPLLTFAHHYFPRFHIGFALGNKRNINDHANATRCRHLNGRASEPCSAHVFDSDHCPSFVCFQAGFNQALFSERVTQLHCGAHFQFLSHLLTCENGTTADTVSPCRVPDIDDSVADTFRCARHQFVLSRNANAHNTDEAVRLIAIIETDFTSNGRDPNAISIPTYPINDAREDVACLWVGRFRKAQSVNESDRSCAHRQNVADDAPDSRRRAAFRLNLRWVVMALHLEQDPKSRLDFNSTRISTCSSTILADIAGQQSEPLL